LGLYCADAVGSQRWRLEFDIRSTLQTDREAHGGSGESLGIVDADTLAACEAVIRAAFDRNAGASVTVGPSAVAKKLKAAAGMDRSQWPPSLLRGIWQALMDVIDGRRLSPAHETRWLNLVGYCLRPGYGMAVDDWRVSEVWRRVHGKLVFPTPGSRTESLILWRRIAGGMTAGQQEQLGSPLLGTLGNKSQRTEAHEAAELWRMVGSLEWIAAKHKSQLATAALAEAGRKRSLGYRDALLWAIGRLCSRQPIYGPLNTVVPADVADEILQTLLADDRELAVRQLAVMQLAQQTGDRYRDLEEASRNRAANWLQRTAAAERYIQLVREGGSPTQEDETALFGESLPLGI